MMNQTLGPLLLLSQAVSCFHLCWSELCWPSSGRAVPVVGVSSSPRSGAELRPEVLWVSAAHSTGTARALWHLCLTRGSPGHLLLLCPALQSRRGSGVAPDTFVSRSVQTLGSILSCRVVTGAAARLVSALPSAVRVSQTFVAGLSGVVPEHCGTRPEAEASSCSPGAAGEVTQATELSGREQGGGDALCKWSQQGEVRQVVGHSRPENTSSVRFAL